MSSRYILTLLTLAVAACGVAAHEHEVAFDEVFTDSTLRIDRL